MGATTKNGRTRNRRVIPLSNPPGGYPNLVTLLLGTRADATQFFYNAAVGPGVVFDGWEICGSGRLQFYNQFSALIEWATISWDAGEGAFEVLWDADPGNNVDVFLLPWQETARGPNGEWFAPFAARLLPP